VKFSSVHQINDFSKITEALRTAIELYPFEMRERIKQRIFFENARKFFGF
jgi:hypothetical protein